MDEPPDGPCSLPNILCGRRCVSPADDPQLRRLRPERLAASASTAAATTSAPETPSRQTRCNDRCTDTNVDRSNCGGCGAACPDGQVCSGGTCQIECGPQYLLHRDRPDGGGVDGGRGRFNRALGALRRPARRRPELRRLRRSPLGTPASTAPAEPVAPAADRVRRPLRRPHDLADRLRRLRQRLHQAPALRQRELLGMACPPAPPTAAHRADLTSSVSHCGMCGNACPAPQFCARVAGRGARVPDGPHRLENRFSRRRADRPDPLRHVRQRLPRRPGVPWAPASSSAV